MKNLNITRLLRALVVISLVAAAVFISTASRASTEQAPPSRETIQQLGQQLRVGDVVFIRIPLLLFTKVADSTGSWTNHVGVVVDMSGSEPVIAESTFPLSRTTTLSRFVARSEKGRFAIARLPQALTERQQQDILQASRKRMGVWYDTGFNLHSNGQFCSRFVYEVLEEAVGVQVGRIETFRELLASNPQADMGFWRIWYFGNIPWERQTVTPASLLQGGRLRLVYDGRAMLNEGKEVRRSQ